MIQVENEKSCDGTAPMQGPGDRNYTEWAIETALGLDTGVPWTFCNNSNSCNLPDTPGVIFTANGQGVAGSWFSGGMYDHYDSQPALWSEVEEGFATWDADLWKSQQPNELARHVAHFYAQ